MERFDSRWGTPLIARIAPADGESWVGMFAAGGLGGVRGVFACPSPTACCVVVDGLAFVVDVRSPEAGALMAHDQITQVVPVEGRPLLLLVRFIDIVALGRDGVAWATPRLVVDDLVVERASATAIVCGGSNLGGTVAIELDPATGRQTGGTRLSDFWPPDAIGAGGGAS